MPNRLEKAVRDHQNAIKAIDRAALGNVLQQYQAIAERLNPQIELLVQDIAGQDFASLSQLLRVTRMQELQRQFVREMDELARQTGVITDIGAGRAVDQAISGAQAVTESSIAGNPATLMTSYNRISPQSVNAFIGATREGPLQELLASFGETVERALIETLTDGIALGTNPRGIANMITRASEIGRNRALTIARTEILRAHRTATLQAYQANADILKGWIWLSAKQTRTCAACLAMDGTFHELTESMANHPNCRCVQRPALKNDPMRKVQTGKQWLDKQPADVQDAVLGKAGGAAYRAGEVELSDFVKVTESKDWGKTTTDGGVGFARLNAARRKQQTPTRRSDVQIAAIKPPSERNATVPDKKPTPISPIDQLQEDMDFLLKNGKATQQDIDETLSWAKSASPQDLESMRVDVIRMKTEVVNKIGVDGRVDLQSFKSDTSVIPDTRSMIDGAGRQDIVNAIREYKYDNYGNINGSLRGEREASDFTLSHIDLIDEAFTMSKPIDGDLILHRGFGATDNRDSVWELSKAGDIISEPGYVSTSYMSGAEFFPGRNGIQFEIYAPKGSTKGLSLDPFAAAEYSSSREKELLLPRDTTFVVRQRIEVFEPGDVPRIYSKIILEVVP